MQVDAPSPVAFPDGVSFVALNSGRWGYREDESSFFDDMCIYVEPNEKGWVTLND